MKPSNPEIRISELGQERSFIGGIKYWRIEWANFNGITFKEGAKVKWYDNDDNKWIRGTIEWLIVTEYGDVDVSINTKTPNIGRLPVDQLELDGKQPYNPLEFFEQPSMEDYGKHNESLPLKNHAKQKELVEFLMAQTQQENRYVGGGDEPSIITFKNSDGFGYTDEDRREWLSGLVAQIFDEIL
jgi:hypothetical protein